MEMKVGILGAGQMGRRHAECLARDERVEIVGVADADVSRAAALASRCSAAAVADLEGLLALGIDMVVVATPNRYHAAASSAALDHGVAVLCEKPMATNLDDARALCDRASRDGAFLVVAHNRRHAPVYRQVHELLGAGFKPVLAHMKMYEGDFRTPPWVSDSTVSGGFLYENLVHFFDLMEWLVAPISEIFCLARKPFYPDLNDFIVSIAFAGGAIGSLSASGHASWLHPAERSELVGDHATVVVEGLDRVVHSPGDGTAVAIHDYSRLPATERWGYEDQDAEVIASFLSAGKTCFSPLRALRTLEIAEGCLRAATEGRSVRIAPPPSD